MSLMDLEIADINKKFHDLGIVCYFLSKENNNIYLRYDFTENENGKSWDEYCSVSEDLRKIGYEFIDPCCEHDCISGYIRRIKM